jgi:AcrR family transcriptional regulator
MGHLTSNPAIDDLTARARIRDAAIDAFAAGGFDATVREIAARAGVSPGLITHHFGSKDALRRACDAEVLRRVLEIKIDGIGRSPSEAVAMIAELDAVGATFGYVLRSVREGGEAGRAFLQHMIEDAMIYTQQAVDAGLVRESVDPRARVELLVTQSIGGMIAQLALYGDVDFSDGAALMSRISQSSSLVILELYTHGMLTDSALFDEFLRQRGVAAGAATAQHPATQHPTTQHPTASHLIDRTGEADDPSARH